MTLLTTFTGEYPTTINLGKLKINDILKIKVLMPNIKETIDLYQGTYTSEVVKLWSKI